VGPRPPGTEANRRATTYAASVLEAAGLPVASLPFRARSWVPGPAALTVDGEPVAIDPPPFCPPASAAGAVVEARDDGELGALDAAPGSVIVLRDELAVPHFPKAFPFVQLPDQQARLARLEALRPAAVLAVVPDVAAHEPVFEDPDLPFPYATVRASVAAPLRPGAVARVVVGGRIDEGDGVNVSAGALRGPRAVVCAHIDSKVTTAGRLDNGGGAATLLALAEAGLDGLGPVELVLFNGEDHVAAPGEQAWLAAGGLDGVELVINVDGAGLRGHGSAVALLGGDASAAAGVTGAIAGVHSASEGPPWFESDHAVFAMQGIPAVAITSAATFDELKRRSHAADEPADVVDPGVLADVVAVIRGILAARADG
jgi:aminopeptidase YwaD